jgi:hypothetical protein
VADIAEVKLESCFLILGIPEGILYFVHSRGFGIAKMWQEATVLHLLYRKVR